MTELQTLIRDSNAMPPVIRADYLEDAGFDLEADWIRRGEFIQNPLFMTGGASGHGSERGWNGAYGALSGSGFTRWGEGASQGCAKIVLLSIEGYCAGKSPGKISWTIGNRFEICEGRTERGQGIGNGSGNG